MFYWSSFTATSRVPHVYMRNEVWCRLQGHPYFSVRLFPKETNPYTRGLYDILCPLNTHWTSEGRITTCVRICRGKTPLCKSAVSYNNNNKTTQSYSWTDSSTTDSTHTETADISERAKHKWRNRRRQSTSL